MTPLLRVGILVYDGVDELDFAGAWSVLRKPARLAPKHPGFHVALLGPPGAITASGGLRFHAQGGFADAVQCDALVIPGGAGAGALSECAVAVDAVRAAVTLGCRVYSVCSGALFLARAGIAPPGPVAVHHARAGELAAAGWAPACGLARAGWLSSVGGEPEALYVKGVEAGFQVLRDLYPEMVRPVAQRMEYRPHLTVA